MSFSASAFSEAPFSALGSVSVSFEVSGLLATGVVDNNVLAVQAHSDHTETGLIATGAVGDDLSFIFSYDVSGLSATGVVDAQTLTVRAEARHTITTGLSATGVVDAQTLTVRAEARHTVITGLSATGVVDAQTLTVRAEARHTLTGIGSTVTLASESDGLIARAGALVNLVGFGATGSVDDNVLSVSGIANVVPVSIEAVIGLNSVLVWSAVVDAQNITWSNINDAQTKNWTNVNDAQTVTWTAVSDSKHYVDDCKRR